MKRPLMSPSNSIKHMNTPTTEVRPKTDHLMTAFSSLRTELDKLGVSVSVRRRDEYTVPTMVTATGRIVSPNIEFERYGGKNRAHVLVYRNGYGRGCSFRYKVGADGSINAKGLAARMVSKIKWDEGEGAREAISREQRNRAKEVLDKVVDQAGITNSLGTLRPVQTVRPEDEWVQFRFERNLTPHDAITVLRALRNAGIKL